MFEVILSVALIKQLVIEKTDYLTELYSQGMRHAQAGDYAKAEMHFTQALAIEPQSEALLRSRSMARGMLGNVAGAAADWEESQKWNPKFLKETIEDAYYAKDWSRIISITELPAKNKRLAPSGCYYRGCALIGVGRDAEAVPFLKRALEREQELLGLSAWAHLVYAELLADIEYKRTMETEYLNQAIHHLDEAWKQNYRSTTVLRLRATLHWILKNRDEAIRDMRNAVLMDSKSVEFRTVLISYLTQSERWEDALEELTWLKRLKLSAAEKKEYAEFLKKVEVAVTNALAKKN